ncbi:MAG TPA: NAD-dependent epimerase/dehydratase family protein, partial [Pyrinomonadaceae bacterium]|nr:NAD-dependent epimerase/dehydratase family protein [Pyrinomonadaceae bacterium]
MLMPRGRVVLAGGSGFLGRTLAEELVRQGREVVVLSRTPGRGSGLVREVEWDGESVGEWARHLEGAEAVVNLAGRSVNCRYTRANRREIVESRVNSVNAVGQAIRRCAQPPKVLVQAASLAIYGDAGARVCDESARVCDESAPAGRGFSAETCVRWEEAFDSFELPATKKVLLRIGFALGRDGGALETLARLAKFYLGGTVGGGR